MRSRMIAPAVAALLAGAGLLWAQSPTTTPTAAEPHAGMHGHQMGESMMGEPAEGGAKMAGCQAMMAKRQAMMEKMRAMDASLDALVQKMNAATGDAKVEAMAAAVTELSTQRTAMRSMMESMQPMMMQHMMQHMQSGTKEGVSGCPMMGGGEAQESGHEMHH